MQNCQFRLVSWLDFEYVKKNILCVQCCGTFALFCRHACFFPPADLFPYCRTDPLDHQNDSGEFKQTQGRILILLNTSLKSLN